MNQLNSRRKEGTRRGNRRRKEVRKEGDSRETFNEKRETRH
jgi:hypothetical protein